MAIALAVIGLAITWFGSVVVFERILTRERRAHERRLLVLEKREQELLNRIMYLSGKPWDGPDPTYVEGADEAHDELTYLSPDQIVGVG